MWWGYFYINRVKNERNEPSGIWELYKFNTNLIRYLLSRQIGHISKHALDDGLGMLWRNFCAHHCDHELLGWPEKSPNIFNTVYIPRSNHLPSFIPTAPGCLLWIHCGTYVAYKRSSFCITNNVGFLFPLCSGGPTYPSANPFYINLACVTHNCIQHNV